MLRATHARLYRQRLENQHDHSQKREAVAGLALGLAHDFNNLFPVITGCCDFLNQVPAEHPGQQEVAEINQAASLTRQLMAFARKQMLP